MIETRRLPDVAKPRKVIYLTALCAALRRHEMEAGGFEPPSEQASLLHLRACPVFEFSPRARKIGTPCARSQRPVYFAAGPVRAARQLTRYRRLICLADRQQ